MATFCLADNVMRDFDDSIVEVTNFFIKDKELTILTYDDGQRTLLIESTDTQAFEVVGYASQRRV
jgi:hypothetical protein